MFVYELYSVLRKQKKIENSRGKSDKKKQKSKPVRRRNTYRVAYQKRSSSVFEVLLTLATFCNLVKKKNTRHEKNRMR